MADHTLETKLLLRYGTYGQWMNSTIILLQGEAAVAIFPRSHNLDLSDSQPENTPPSVGLKIGDGIHYFYELPWVQAVAADVYEWAKAETKPSYSASEITGLTEFVNNINTGGGGSGGSTGGGQYRIVYDSTLKKYILQQYNESTNAWEDTTSNIDFSGVLNRLDTIERWANGALRNLGNIELPLSEYVYSEVVNYLNILDYNDQAISHQFVTSVRQVDGQITVTRSIISANDISAGILPSQYGGTGFNFIDEDETLTGSLDGTLVKKKIVTEIGSTQRSAFATVGAIKDYVDEKTAGITGAMHFIGESNALITNNGRVDPQIVGYNFRDAKPGDVILANNAQEYVWTGSNWRLLGDEGSYAIKGSIVNADISENAAISQSKIDGLETTLENKVTVIEGKQLSTNDYTNEDKDKVASIEAGAQVNVIEHILLNDTEIVPNNDKAVNLHIPVLTEEQLIAINNAEPNIIEHVFVNGIEINPTIINQLPKSVNITFTPFTSEEKEKLSNIEAGAQKNKIETIIINGTEYTANNLQQVEITIDQAALNLNVLEGARYPSGNLYTDIDITNKKLELSKVAATGNIDDLVQTSNTYIIINCGNSVDVMN